MLIPLLLSYNSIQTFCWSFPLQVLAIGPKRNPLVWWLHCLNSILGSWPNLNSFTCCWSGSHTWVRVWSYGPHPWHIQPKWSVWCVERIYDEKFWQKCRFCLWEFWIPCLIYIWRVKISRVGYVNRHFRFPLQVSAVGPLGSRILTILIFRLSLRYSWFIVILFEKDVRTQKPFKNIQPFKTVGDICDIV